MSDLADTSRTTPPKTQDSIRRAAIGDTTACARIMYEAFKGIAYRHNFPPDFPSVDMAGQFVPFLIQHPEIYGIVLERGGKVLGSNFLDERSVIRGVGPLTVDTSCQQGGIGRRLMEAVLERASGAQGVRLLQDAFNMASYSLYASLGFDVKEPLVLMQGRPKSSPAKGYTVRPMREEDFPACAALATAVHGFSRENELRDAMKLFQPFVAIHGNQLRAYATAPTFWPLNHGVGETIEDLQALLCGAAAAVSEPLSLIVPTRRGDFFRWCLAEGLRSVKPMTLMAIGRYQDPRGAFFPSVGF